MKFQCQLINQRMQGIRHYFSAICFLSLISNFTLRVNLNVAIVAMVNSSAVYSDERSVSQSNNLYCSYNDYLNRNGSQPRDKTKDGEFLWSPATQGIIIGAYFYGYCSFQIVSGRLAELYSRKWVFGVGSFLASVITLLTPLAAYHSVTAIVSVRVLLGISQSVMMPALYSLGGRWLPDSERGLFAAALCSGMSFGTLIGMTVSGLLCNSDFLNGWPSVFYVFVVDVILGFKHYTALFGWKIQRCQLALCCGRIYLNGFTNCIVVVIWCLFVTDSPESHPLITQEEVQYISSNQEAEMTKEIPLFPWIKVFASVPFWALVFTQIGMEWCFYIFISDLPQFFATILHFDIEKNGLLSSLPFFLKAVVSTIVGWIAEILIRKQLSTVNFIRKFCTLFPFLWVSAGLLGVCLAGCDTTLSVLCFMCSIPALGFTFSGISINHLDLSPEYAGTLYAIANTFSSLLGFLAPMYVGFLTDENQSMKEWRIVFGSVIVVLLLSAFVFGVFGSTKRQNWIPNSNKKNCNE